MKNIAKLNKELCDKIVKDIEDFERRNGVEFTGLKAYPYFQNWSKKRITCISLGIKER